jgi:hypothetical protein
MNFRLVLTLSLVGVLIALGTTFGLLHAGVEKFAWLAACVLLAVVVAMRAPGRPFLHGLFAGLLAGVLCQIVQAILFDRYLAQNPTVADSFKRLPPGLSPQVLLLVSSPVTGAIYGVVIGLLAWLVARVAKRRSAPA